MVRSRRILEIVEPDGLIDQAASGKGGYLLDRAAGHRRPRIPARSANVRGRGLLCAVDLPDRGVRDRGRRRRCASREHVIVLPCGERVDPLPPRAVGERR